MIQRVGVPSIIPVLYRPCTRTASIEMMNIDCIRAASSKDVGRSFAIRNRHGTGARDSTSSPLQRDDIDDDEDDND